MNIAFTTSLFGDRGNNPAIFRKSKKYDYFLFGDKNQDDLRTSWNVINISDHKSVRHLKCNIKKSRYSKFFSHKLLKKKYDIIYYCDAHWSPKINVDWINLSSKILQNNFALAQDLHPNAFHDGRSIVDEMRGILSRSKDSIHRLNLTQQFLSEKYPKVALDKKTKFYENTIFGYSPLDKNYNSIVDEFWGYYSNVEMSYRDQPFWNVLLRQKSLQPLHLSLKNFFEKTGAYGNHTYIE